MLDEQQKEPWIFTCSSGFGYRTRQPFVQMRCSAAGLDVQMPVEDARALAQNLLEAAEAAEGDGFLVTFLTGKLGADMEAAAMLLGDFRKWRNDLRFGDQEDEHTPGAD